MKNGLKDGENAGGKYKHARSAGTGRGQWGLNAWPNVVFTAVALLVTFYLAWKRGYSPMEMVSASANQTFVQTLRARFPRLPSRFLARERER